MWDGRAQAICTGWKERLSKRSSSQRGDFPGTMNRTYICANNWMTGRRCLCHCQQMRQKEDCRIQVDWGHRLRLRLSCLLGQWRVCVPRDSHLSHQLWYPLWAVLVAQLCPILYPTNYSPSGSSVHGILHARILEWVAISFLLFGIFLTQGLNPGLLSASRIFTI